MDPRLIPQPRPRLPEEVGEAGRLGELIERRIDAVVAHADRLERGARDMVRRAYREAGMTGPALPEIVARAARLIDLHLEARQVT